MLLSEYSRRIEILDKLDDNSTIRQGIFGEVGSILTTAKKKTRDGMSFDYRLAITEEFGDAIWYFFRLSARLGFSPRDVIPLELCAVDNEILVATGFTDSPIALAGAVAKGDFPQVLRNLGAAASELLNSTDEKCETNLNLLRNFFSVYLCALQATDLSFVEVLEKNLAKTEGRFLVPDPSTLPVFDDGFENDERLPQDFEISILERGNGKSYLKWKDVFIGDPLTDNIGDEDGYKFHDVFHMANAAILHWSPTFRALIRHKRKSSDSHDEQQDGGRAIVIEEGLTAWIFSLAKRADYFEHQQSLSFDLLKGVQQFVSGFEVERCPLSLWERAILDGYKVFRELKRNRGGIVIGSRIDRTITYRET